ncbi:serine hydrolase [Robiginitalea sp. SC105]|uniref:serine hydrolase domain-containing protein n=1 Tax=Robiginitalea sp. SC105 TaxID=2762332 RepID=UPI00163A4283|nr:serine hydrolase [Robiginitalea sp. SC105]MBC2840351.1 serine hydrolase [Robiginitalea sp. SC105]
MKIILFVFAISLLLGITACTPCNSSFRYSQPENIGDGFNTGNLEEVGIDTALISEAIREIHCGRFNEIHSMLIYRDSLLVLEQYFEGYKYQWDAPGYRGEQVQWEKDMLHPTMSCTKSFVSACIGMAINQGYIKDIKEPIFNYLPDHQQYKTGGKEHITIAHLLTMTSGLAWDEWGAAHGTSANDIDRLYFDCSNDPITCVLERDLVHKPGAVFNYNGGGVVLLGEILKNATQRDFAAFSKAELFEPLEIDSVAWYQFNNGVYATDGSMYLTPRSMLKFGVLYQNGGKWRGKNIIPETWIEKSTAVFGNNRDIRIPIEDSGKNDYGYLWWISHLAHKGKQVNMYRANGWGGQTIMVFPELNMTVEFTSGNYATGSRLFRLVENYVLPAVE